VFVYRRHVVRRASGNDELQQLDQSDIHLASVAELIEL
jgi:hypothetical protein